MPALDRLAPGAVHGIVQGVGVMDRMRDQAVSGHQGVLDQIHQKSDNVAAVRAAKPMIQPYLS